MKYRIKKEKREEALKVMREKGTFKKLSRLKNLVYEQKPMQVGQWLRYLSMEEMDYFLEPFEELKLTPICCICGNPCENEWGNNPYPVKEEGRCCDVCNMTQVLPKRIELLNKEQTKKQEEPKVEKLTKEEIEDYYGI